MFLLSQLVFINEQILAIAVGIVDTAAQFLVKANIAEIRGEVQRLTAVHIDLIAQVSQTHLIAVFSLNQILSGIAELHLRTDDINTSLGTGCIELADIGKMLLIFVHCFLTYRNGLFGFKRIVISLDDTEL